MTEKDTVLFPALCKRVLDDLKLLVVSDQPEAQKLISKAAPLLVAMTASVKRLEKIK